MKVILFDRVSLVHRLSCFQQFSGLSEMDYGLLYYIIVLYIEEITALHSKNQLDLNKKVGCSYLY